MRTTVDIPDHLFALAKHRAAASHTSLREVISEGLRVLLVNPPAVPTPQPKGTYRFPTVAGQGGLAPGLEGMKSSELLEIE